MKWKIELTSNSQPSFATVSPAELQDKTALFIQGKIDAKNFYFVLKSAFGDKLSFVLPGIYLPYFT